MQLPIFNAILEVRVIDMVDHCGQGLFHHIAWQNRPIQIITVGGPGYLGIWEYPLDIPGTPSPDQQFSRATILAYDGQVAVVRHYPHLLSPISVNTEMSVFLRTFYAAICMSALGPKPEVFNGLGHVPLAQWMSAVRSVTAYHRRAAPCARIKHLVTCRSQ